MKCKKTCEKYKNIQMRKNEQQDDTEIWRRKAKKAKKWRKGKEGKERRKGRKK